MPPADAEQPSEAERLLVATWIEETLRSTACRSGEFAGWVTTRRLNRREYDNTIRDLLGVDLELSRSFPVDGSGGEGFDNNGETLFLPPLLLERYLEAATQALDVAIVTPPVDVRFDPRELFPPKARREAIRPLEARQSATATVTIHVGGEYAVAIRATVGGADGGRGELLVDGIPAEAFDVAPATRLPEEDEANDGKANGKADNGGRADGEVDGIHEIVVRLARGVHTIGVRNAKSATLELGEVRIRTHGPPPSDERRRSHEQLIGTLPGSDPPKQPRVAATKILGRFARRAFRRPLREGELSRLMRLYDRGADRGDPFEAAVKLAMKGVLVSSHFLFRVEAEPSDEEPNALTDHELAARLSYFLWSSMPDRELRDLADRGQLSEPDVLVGQMNRLLGDPRSDAFLEQFVGQWLGTREVGALVAPDTSTFKGQFTTELLLDLREEPVRFFEYLVAEDRSVIEFLSSDYAIVNDRLAKHYELVDGPKPKNPANPWVPNPKQGSGGPFRRMPVENERRGGVLGMGAVHMLTSRPNRTSPVLRGGWVLETLLGTRVPSPPPDVPELKRGRGSKRSVREQLEEHRRNPSCAACHDLIDPVGFALDNYDVLGRWREKEAGERINASAVMPDGRAVEGPAGLRRILLTSRERFLHELVSRMLGYAIGRSLEDADDCTVQRIAEKLADDEYRARVLIREVVLSTPFRMKQRSPE